MANEGFVFGSDYLSLPKDPQPWVVRNLIPIGGIVNLYGRPKTGKSFAAIGLAQAVASGAKTWLGFEIVKPGRVMYLQIDTPRSTWIDRLETIRKSGYDLNNIFFADTILSPYPFNILIPEHQAWLKAQVKAINPILIIIDTIRELHGGDENDSTVMKNVISQLVDACRPAAVVILSHSRKENMMQGEDIMTDARGSSYIAGRMDTIAKLTGKTLIYKGRSCGENKIKVRQHPLNGMLMPEEDDKALLDLIAAVVAQNPGKTKNWIAKVVHERCEKTVSVKTITRKIEENNLMEGDETEVKVTEAYVQYGSDI